MVGAYGGHISLKAGTPSAEECPQIGQEHITAGANRGHTSLKAGTPSAEECPRVAQSKKTTVATGHEEIMSLYFYIFGITF